MPTREPHPTFKTLAEASAVAQPATCPGCGSPRLPGWGCFTCHALRLIAHSARNAGVSAFALGGIVDVEVRP